MARIRSPNYPQISLALAIERVRMIYKAERENRIDRDVALKLMGFGGYNGASAGVLSAITKFGLLEATGAREMKVSGLAVRILVPHDDAERAAALAEAASKPPLFVELAERWPTDAPSHHSLRTYLTRRGFADSAVESVIKSYTDTQALVRETVTQYDGPSDTEEEADDVGADRIETLAAREAARPPAAPAAPPVAAPPVAAQGPGMTLVRGNDGYVIHLSGSVLTKGHVDEVVRLLTALKESMPESVQELAPTTEH